MRKVIGFIASVVVVVGFAHPVNAMSETHDDYCSEDTYPSVVCVDDYPCELVAKLVDVESWQCSHAWEFGRHF